MLKLHEGIKTEQAAEIMKSTLLYEGERLIRGAAIDSRKVKEGDLFVCIKGERTDGHRFVRQACAQGCSAVLIESPLPCDDLAFLAEQGCGVIEAEHTGLALGRLAKAHKESCPAITVGVTGSVGKTTTRQYIYAVLREAGRTHKTDGNLNNEWGLPLTLMSLDDDDIYSVLEMGMSAKGEISYLTNIVCPDIAVITNIGTAHIEFFGSREGIRDAKMEIVEGLKQGGKLILNGDEPLLAGKEGAVYVALQNENADYRAIHIQTTPSGMTFDAVTPGGIITGCAIPTYGTHTVFDAMFAIAVGDLCHLTSEQILRGLSAFEGVGDRQKVVEHRGVTYILDYYNAGTESMMASLSVLHQLADQKKGRAIAVLGSVMELGEMSESLHRKIGHFAASLPVDLLFTFGHDMGYAAEEAASFGIASSNIFSFPDLDQPTPLIDALSKTLTEGDTVLFKASHSVGMERVALPLIQA